MILRTRGGISPLTPEWPSLIRHKRDCHSRLPNARPVGGAGDRLRPLPEPQQREAPPSPWLLVRTFQPPQACFSNVETHTHMGPHAFCRHGGAGRETAGFFRAGRTARGPPL